jgi:hypothetical protein
LFASQYAIQRRLTPRVLAGSLLALVVLCATVVYANKAARNASAILRWRELIQSVARGENVYNEWTKDGSFPYPPAAGLLLWPLTQLPPLPAALVWFFLKLLMATLAIRWAIQLVAGDDAFSPWQVAILLALASRPLLSDLQHGNINILILFLTTAGLTAFRNNRLPLAGTLIALAGAIKVTPLLFIPYFALKQQWRVVAWSAIGLGIFLVFLPATILGFERNWWLIRSWSGAMIEPYVFDGQVETLQTNQSLPGVLSRLLTDCPGIELEDGTQLRINWVHLRPETATWLVKGVNLTVLAWVGWLSRSRLTQRCDTRLACEYALVFIAMLLVSERSWKHHFVTMTLPYAALVAHARHDRHTTRTRGFVWATIAAAFLLMASTSSELGGWLGGTGHKLAQGYGMFCASAIVVLLALSVLHLRPGLQTPIFASDQSQTPKPFWPGLKPGSCVRRNLFGNSCSL